MCFQDGGIVDDLLIYRLPSHFMMVVNAANLQKDFQWMQSLLMDNVELTNVSDKTSLLAIQGRFAQALLQKLVDIDLASIDYYWASPAKCNGIEVLVSRTGYTGEDGFELYFPVQHSMLMWEKIIDAGKEYNIEPAGLGARDTLRLEMKYCLYGNDIDQTTNPLEAGLGWITKLKKGDFIAREALLEIKEKGIQRKLVGFEVEGKAFPRHGYSIFYNDEKIGTVTSGTFSPSLETGIGMGYVPTGFADVGTGLDIEIRGKKIPARIVKTPFYERPY
jgi:aminomethyltransferase